MHSRPPKTSTSVRRVGGAICLAVAILAGLLPGGRLDADDIRFDVDVRPILSDSCYNCHGPDEASREADLRLDTHEGLLGADGEGGVVTPGDPDDSELIRRVTSVDEDEQMPPPDAHRKLSAAEITTLVRWVEAGAPWQRHWAFIPPQKPSPPSVTLRDWPENPIDHFVLARLEQAGLAPSEEADRERLLRRVTLDLTGLPPTLAEIDAFLEDKSPGAYERVVDRLLDSAAYGERMAWPWLDAARYADTNGYQDDRERTMWPWRDWVVKALNANMPYDQFTVEQVAGDLLPEATDEQRLATAFCRNHMINGEGGRIHEENRVEYIFDQIETVGTVWLGLTMNCARCHDHKFDPISQREYYQFFAYFNQTPVTGRGRDPQTPPVLEIITPEQAEQRTELTAEIEPARVALAAFEQTFFAPEDGQKLSDTPKVAKHSDYIKAVLNKPVVDRDAGHLRGLVKTFEKIAPEYAAEVQKLHAPLAAREKLQSNIPRVMIMQDRGEPRSTFVLTRGLYNQRTDEVTAALPSAMPGVDASAPANRLTVARWLIDEQNPLTARVTVNRYWQLFFGNALVKTSENLGSQGTRPTHPALLDYLARRFMESDWNVKQLHRLIVTSATYRQSAATRPELQQRDAENRLYGRGPRFRMPSWMMRDQALAASGLLVRTMGGPPVKPYQPPGLWTEATFGRKVYRKDSGDNLYRRSLYTYWRRIIGPTMFFDTAKRQTCVVRPSRTNSPLHTLVTLNDTTFVEAARVLAQRVMQEAERAPDARLTRAFRLVTSRRPEPEELAVLTSRLTELQRHFAAHAEAATKLVSVGDSPRDETLDVAEHAAYSSVCLAILNLDEALNK
ncbi:MAG: DUF1549 domain-containing protein [Planctomycetota bacterium]|nr:MAG: DUF1549 domain-containing protein [Planctomycetota bacterium]REK48502.1 MAG: DUF1549 domain-containing protein [Planctomycetota bacterium]